MIKEIKAEFRKYRSAIFLIFAFFMTASFAFFAASGMKTTSAVVSTAGFNPGNIISDAVMANYNSMSLADIQNFLTSKNPCSNNDYNYYLQLTAANEGVNWHWENGHFICLSEERFGENDNEIGAGQTAAEIIYEAAQEYRVNPQVLMVLLQKESSLITDPIPNDYNYRRATGYGCPDSTPGCSGLYSGFKKQVNYAAALFRKTLDNGYSGYPEKTKGVYVGYNPKASCGGTEVYIENRATSSLYRYTPYQPNAAALAAGYGAGDSCSAYGNRNFYLYFLQWFGSTQAVVDGEQTIIPDGEYGFISKSAPTKALDIAGASTSENANIQIWNRDTSAARTWRVHRNPDTGLYTIADTRSNKFLSTTSTALENGTNVILSSVSDCRSQWKIYETSDHYLAFESSCASGMMLDNAGGFTFDGNNVQIWHAHTEDAEKWSIYTGQTIDDGVYTISSANDSNKMIDNAGGWSRNGNNVQIWDSNYAEAQKWRAEYDKAKDAYTFVNPQTNKRLDLAGEQTSIGTNIRIWDAANACSQYWKVINLGGSYMILSTCSPSRAIDLVGGSTVNLTNIRIWSVNDTNAQRWNFHNQQILPEGNYEIRSKADQNYAIDIAGGLDYDAANVNLYQSNNVASAQLWHLRYNKQTGDYTLLNQSGERSLDLSGGNINIGTNIQIWSNNNACAQRWTLVDNQDGSITFISSCQCDRALDLAGGLAYNTNNIRLWSTNGADAQKWYFIRK